MKACICLGIGLVVLLASCRQKNRPLPQEPATVQTYQVYYATGYTVNRTSDYTEVKIRDPWDTTRYLQRYVLVDKDKALPVHLPKGILVRTPLQRVVVATAVHCGVLELLGMRDQLVGVCESRYIDLDFVKRGLASGKIVDIGEAGAPDVERLIELAPDAMITSPLNNAPYGRVEKTGIPQIKCVDYMEPTPLGRVEWIRFQALFFGKEEIADSLFWQTVKAYEEIKALTEKVKERPLVVTEKKYGAVWYLPGSKSYMAHLLEDAGATIGKEAEQQAGSVGWPFETVFEKYGDADFWLIKYNRPQEMSYEDLKTEYAAYSKFAAYKNRRIYTCNTAEVPYYEEVPVHPDYLLKDLVAIFHPELLPEHQMKYYKAMEN